MGNLLSIGDFSRMSFLSVKTLRHYHDIGLLPPADIDPASGYRRYRTEQLPQAQVIIRLRGFGMPLEEIKQMLSTSDVDSRNDAIIAHLERMERQLEQTRATVASLRLMLDGQERPLAVEHRRLDSCWAVAIGTETEMSELAPWLADARRRLAEAIQATALSRTGPDGSLYFEEFFTTGGIKDLGDVGSAEIIAYIPVDRRPDPERLDAAGFGDVFDRQLPAVDVAVTTHPGSCADLDRSYALLGTYITERAIGVAGPIREHHLDPIDAPQHQLRTEVAWPIFAVAT